MAANQIHIGEALDLLTSGFAPFVEQKLKDVYGQEWYQSARNSFRDDRSRPQPKGEVVRWDAHALLTVVWDQWNPVFREHLGLMERSLIGELREWRNRWAHNADFDTEDAFRVVDSVYRLLNTVGAPEKEDVGRIRWEMLEKQFGVSLNLQLRRANQRKKQWLVISINTFCCTAVLVQMATAWGWDSLLLMAVVTLMFTYMTYRQLARDPQELGPHECPRCRKIVYTISCPYCESKSRRHVASTSLIERELTEQPG